MKGLFLSRRAVLGPTRVAGACVAVAMLLAGCAAPYDKGSDDAMAGIQKKLDDRIVAINAKGAAKHEDGRDEFYLGIRHDIEALKVRTLGRRGAWGADPSIPVQAELLDVLQIKGVDNLWWLENTRAEREKTDPAAIAKPSSTPTTSPSLTDPWLSAQSSIDTQANAFLTTELARKE
ncbi:MAG: hypothetical protein QM754_17720 [Tepidisphaeraceae bacterium]